jgi:autotransporter-associated beta strand protein
MKINKLSLLLAASMAVSLAAHASLIAYEGFKYTNAFGSSVNLTATNGGTGWLTAFKSNIGLSNNLSYAGIYSPSGTKAFAYIGGTSMGDGRDWGSTNTYPANGVYWYGFLINPTTTNCTGYFNIMKALGDSQNGIGLRFSKDGSPTGNPQFAAWSPVQASGGFVIKTGGFGATFFVVGRITFTNTPGVTTNVNNTLWVYQNGVDAMPATEPLVGAANSSTLTIGWAGNAEKARTTIGGKGNSSNQGTMIDEIRIGTSFADVLPPSSLVWAGDGTANAWDNLAGNTDWLLGAAPTYFQTGNYVSFTDASTNQTVNINDAVQPNVAIVNSSSNYVFTGTGKITGSSASLSKSGSGTLTISITNDYNGGTVVSGGILVLATNQAVGSGAVTLDAGSQRLVVNDDVTLTNSIVIAAGAGTGNGGQGLIQNSGATNATLSGGTITFNGAVASGGVFSSTGGGTLTVADPITSSISIANGVRLGTVIMSGGGAYPGIDISEGTLQLGAADGLCTTSIVNVATATGVNGYFDLAGFNQTLGGITKGGGSASATIGNSSTVNDSILTTTKNCTYAGVIQDVIGSGSRTVALTVSSGTLTLSAGASTYTGNTTVNGGLLLLAGYVLGNTEVTVSSGGGVGGAGIMAGNVSVGSNCRVFPGGSNTVGALTINGNYTLASGNTNYFDVGNSSADAIYVGGTFSASGTTVIDVKGLGNQVASTYPLISFVSGTPVIGNFVLVAHGDFGTLTPSLQVTATTVDLVLQDLSAALVWRGDGSANTWDLSTFSTNWLDSNTSLLTYFRDADRVTFDDTAIYSTVNITATVIPGSIAVNSINNFTFNGTGKFSGGTPITKSGTGTLTINTTNDNTAGVTINDGVLKIGTVGALGNGPLALNAPGTLDVNGNSMLFAANFGSGAVNSSVGTPVITISNNALLTLSGSITNSGGSLKVIKLGGGNLELNNPNGYTGGTTVGNGDVVVRNAGAVGSGTVTYVPGGSQLFIGNGVTFTNNIIINGGGQGSQGLIESESGGIAIISGGPINIVSNKAAGGYFGSSGGGTLTIAAPIIVNEPTVTTLGDIVRRGTVIFSGGGSYSNLGITEGEARLGANNGIATNASVAIGTGGGLGAALLDLAGFNQTLAGLGPVNATVSYITNSALGADSDSLLTLTGTSTYSRPIVDGATRKIALTVAGSPTNTFTLNATSTYTGNTTVSGGTLLVNGAIGNTAVSVSGTGVLGGTGIVRSNTVVSGTGTLSPGANAIGTLSFSNNLTLSGNALFQLNRSVNPSNDFVIVAGTLTGGGFLTATNIGTVALTNGNTFKLFSQPVSGITLTNLPTLGANLGWTNNLAVDGSIAVISTYVTPAPTNMTYTINGSELVLNWPAGQGWLLQAQTNNLGTGLTTIWHTITGATPPFTNNINAANPTVFYRLTAP